MITRDAPNLDIRGGPQSLSSTQLLTPQVSAVAPGARRSSAVEPNMPLAKKLQEYKSQNEVLANEFKQLQ